MLVGAMARKLALSFFAAGRTHAGTRALAAYSNSPAALK